MYTKDDVKRLLELFGESKFDPAPEIEQGQFGLSAHAFDPVSGQIITLAQPHRADIGQPEILLTPPQARQAVAAARAHHVQNVRAAGFASVDAFNEHQKRLAATNELVHNQAMERAKLDEDQAEARSAEAAKAGPTDEQRDAARERQQEASDVEERRRQNLHQGRPAVQEDASRRESLVDQHTRDRDIRDGYSTGQQALNPNATGPGNVQGYQDESRRESPVV